MNLKPCPFCSGPNTAKNEIQHRNGCFMVLQAMPKPDTTSQILWEAWNTRYEPARAQRDELAALLREARAKDGLESRGNTSLRARIDAALAKVGAE
jgi:hypothetical protein